jgi:hypothetical protein
VIDSFLTLIEFILKKKNYENSTLACEGNSLPPYVVWFHHNLAGFSSSINEFWFVFLCHYPHRDGRHTLLTFVVYVCPFRSYSRFLLWPEIATATGIFFFGGGGFRGCMRTSNWLRKCTYLCQSASFEASCMLVRRSVRPIRYCEGKYINSNIHTKCHKVVTFHVCVSASSSNRSQWKFAHLLGSPMCSLVPLFVVVC